MRIEGVLLAVVWSVAAAARAEAPQEKPAAPAWTPPPPLRLEDVLKQPRQKVPVDGGRAKVVIVKFTDFQCSPCAKAREEYRPVLARWEARAPGRVRLIIKDFPLKAECNPNLKSEFHPGACAAAAAVRLAPDARRKEQLAEWLYAHQEGMTADSVRQAAAETGGISNFDARYPAALKLVKEDVALATRLGVRGTPTFFVNGLRIDQPLPAAFLDALIAHELNVVAER
jgi:protein-disulfide isomerase